MKRSVQEKRRYHAKGLPKGDFSAGYIIGVSVYINYGKGGEPVHKDKRSKYIDNIKLQARRGDLYSKGIMCGIKDAANERKERQREKSEISFKSLAPRRGVALCKSVAPCKGVKK